MKEEDGVDLEDGDFRIARRYLHPQLFASGDDDATKYPPPDELISEDAWDDVVVLPTDVLLKSTSYEGDLISRLSALHSDWIFSWPEIGTAPFVDEVALLVGEEFDALVFNAAHGYYRQAIGCLRNAIELMTVAAGLAVTKNGSLFKKWHQEGQEISFGQARSWLRDSPSGKLVDAEASPSSIFGDDDSHWLKRRYARLCGYSHSRAGYNNADFWESNGPIFVPTALGVVEQEFRETLAVCYLLLRLAWPNHEMREGERNLIHGEMNGWEQFQAVLRKWLNINDETISMSMDPE